MIVVKQAFNTEPGKHVVLVVGLASDEVIGIGVVLRAGTRTWTVKAMAQAPQAGALQLNLDGAEPLNERMELRIDGTGMGKAEFARTAEYLGKIARLLPGMDLKTFVRQCGEGMDPLRDLAELLVPVAALLPPLQVIDALTGGPK